jgi:hypothetical protein
LYDEFDDPISGNPMVRVYQQRLPEPLTGSVGQIVRFTIGGAAFEGEIKEIDHTEAVIALIDPSFTDPSE